MASFPPARRFLGYVCPRILLNKNSVYASEMGPQELAKNPLLMSAALTEENRQAVSVGSNRTMLIAGPIVLGFAAFLAYDQMQNQKMPAENFKAVMAMLLVPGLGLPLSMILYKKTRRQTLPGMSEEQSLNQAVALHLATEMTYGKLRPEVLNMERYSIYAQRSHVSASMPPNIPQNQKIRFWIIDKQREEDSGLLLASGFQSTYGGPVKLDEEKLKQLLQSRAKHDTGARLTKLSQ